MMGKDRPFAVVVTRKPFDSKLGEIARAGMGVMKAAGVFRKHGEGARMLGSPLPSNASAPAMTPPSEAQDRSGTTLPFHQPYVIPRDTL